MLSPRDITNKSFGKSTFGGYKQEEVNDFLMQVAEDYSRIQSERTDMEQQLSRVLSELEKYEQEQGSLSTVLVGAQKMADSIIRDAKGQSELIQRDAEIRADKMLEGTQRQLEMEKQEYAQLKTEVSEFRSTILNLYKSHLELVNALPTSDNNNYIRSNSAPERIAEPPAPEVAEEQIGVQEDPAVDRETNRRRKGFVPDLDNTPSNVPNPSGFSFQKQNFQEAQGENNEINNADGEAITQLADPLLQTNETDVIEIQDVEMETAYSTGEYEEVEERQSRFGQLQFGENYQLNREDERRHQKKKRR